MYRFFNLTKKKRFDCKFLCSLTNSQVYDLENKNVFKEVY